MLEPFGLKDIIWLPALRTGSRMASMHVSSQRSSACYDQRETSLFILFAPHVYRALAFPTYSTSRRSSRETLQRKLDGLTSGVFLPARDGRVVYINATAERRIKSGNADRIVNNCISPTDPDARGALNWNFRKRAFVAGWRRVRHHAVRMLLRPPGARRRERRCVEDANAKAVGKFSLSNHDGL